MSKTQCLYALEQIRTGTARQVQQKLLEMGIKLHYDNVSNQLSKCYFDRDITRVIVKHRRCTEYQYSI